MKSTMTVSEVSGLLRESSLCISEVVPVRSVMAMSCLGFSCRFSVLAVMPSVLQIHGLFGTCFLNVIFALL